MFPGFKFNAKTTATPTFGTGSITFGTPAASQPPQQFGFGSLSSSTSGLFGTQTPATTSSLGFGAPTSMSNTGYSFGTSTSAFGGTSVSNAPSTGFSFGTPASSAPSTGFAFGTPVSSTPSTGFSFGTPASSTGLTFGTPASTTVSTGFGFKPAGTSFGTPASTSTGLSFGAPTTGLNFGTPASTSSGLSFGTTTSAPAFGTPTSTATSGFTFGAAPITSAPSLGLTSTPILTSTGFGLGGVTTSSGLGLTTTTTQQNVGLGGIAFTQSKTDTSTTAQKELPPREQLLPNEFSQLVEHFKNVVQEEKNRSSDVARVSVKEFHKVENELDSLNTQFNQIENQLLNNRSLAEQLKYETAKGLQNIEMAQRTQETPPSLQFENTAPLQYFLELAENFEREMQQLKLKIENTEKFVKKCNEPNVVTSQDLALGLKRLHETFIALAGRMQSVHSQVEGQKEAFLGIRKQVVKDNVNPFERIDKNNEGINLVMKTAAKTTPPNLATGPTPFSSIVLSSNNITLAAQQTQTPSFPTATTTTATSGLGFNFGSTPTFGTAPGNTSLFKPQGFGTSPFQLNNTSNFQLQKPPTGTKRGKP